MSWHIKCDQCEKVAERGRREGWLSIEGRPFKLVMEGSGIDLDFCSWRCLKNYAVHKVREEPQ